MSALVQTLAGYAGDFRFASPWYLLLLALLPVWGFGWRRLRKKHEGAVRFSDIRHMKAAPRTLRTRFRWVKTALRHAALALMIAAMARPQSGWTERNLRTDGIDIMITLDVSGSMRAMDFKPNRLEAAKEIIAEFVDGRESDRVGNILFASTAFTLCPLTLDYGVIKGYLKEVDFGIIDDQRTAIGLGLAASVNKLKDSRARSRVVILLTDGDNNVWDIAPLTAAEAAKALGIRVYTIGVGSRGTAMIPVDMGAFGIVNRPMQMHIDEKSLTEIAEMTGGRYFRATDNLTLQEIFREIDAMETTEVEVTERHFYDELMAWFLWPALFLLFLELILGGTLFLKIP